MRLQAVARWRHFLGSVVQPLWAWAVVGALGLYGNAQTIVGLLPAEQAERVDAMMALPSWDAQEWAIASLCALLLVLFEGSFRRHREVSDRLDLESQYYRNYYEAFHADVGDVPVEHVFYWINIAMLEEHAWEVIGRDLQDRLHLGQISAWGRPIHNGRAGTLTKLPHAVWDRLTFSYYFFMPDGEDSQHTFHPNQGATNYTDLRFNAAQIEALWPIPSRPVAAKKSPWWPDIGR